jgi:uncharacterized membrane protein YedE/YeeE
MRFLRAPAWSPYAAGILLGLLQIPAFLLVGTALGVSSSYVTVSGHLAAAIAPMAASVDYIARHLEGAKNWWQVALVVGIAVGAFVSSRLSGTRRGAPAGVWRSVAGAATPRGRFLLAFVGGFVLLLGARIADGCTTGHGLSGLAQLAVGSFVAVAAMFAGGIATALLMRKGDVR